MAILVWWWRVVDDKKVVDPDILWGVVKTLLFFMEKSPKYQGFLAEKIF